MERKWPIFIFGIGLIGLGYWSYTDHADRMEQQVTADVASLMPNGTRHGANIAVSGRDIEVSGVLHDQAEQEKIYDMLNAIDGRRVVRMDDIELLPVGAPYIAKMTKNETGLSGQFMLPDAKIKSASMAKWDGLTNAEVSLASGMPSTDWPDIGIEGARILDAMEFGEMSLVDKTLTLSGFAKTQESIDALNALSDNMPEGYEADISAVSFPDPFNMKFNFDAAEGISLSGIAPEGFDPAQIGQGLGLSDLDISSVNTDGIGEIGDISGLLSVAKGMLPNMETLEINLEKDKAPRMSGTTLPAVNAEQLVANARENLPGFDFSNIEVSQKTFTDGMTRTNALSGVSERYFGGFWVPQLTNFEANTESCAAESKRSLAEAKIEFTSGGANLTAESRQAVNQLAAIISRCFERDNLRIVLGGHTDSQGDDAFNYSLSVDRVNTVREALIARGVDGSRMTAIGYGETEPVADNNTPEGRALNRRTEVEWVVSN